MEQALSDRQLLAALGLLAVLVIVGGRSRPTPWAQRSGVWQLFVSRFHFLLLGLLLSESGLNVMGPAVVHELDALVTLGLGVLGLLLGLTLRRVEGERRLTSAGVIESVTTLVLVSGPLFFLLQRVAPLDQRQRAAAAALVGCIAAISGCRFQRGRAGAEWGWMESIGRVADLSTVIGVLAAGVLLAMLRHQGGMSPLARLLALAAIGTGGGLVAWLLGSETEPGPLRTTLMLGVLLVTAGTATHLVLSPVAATLLMGVTIGSLPGSLADELSSAFAFLERPLGVLLLVIAGAAVRVPTWEAFGGILMFLLLRTAGKIAGGRLGAAVSGGVLPRDMGLGLLPSSAVAVGLALDFHATAPAPVAEMVVTTSVLGSLLSETAALWTVQLLLQAHLIASAPAGVPAELSGEEHGS